MTKQIYLFLSLVFLFSISNLSAQKVPIKFGKISAADLNMEVCSYDSAAHAMILADIGDAELVLEPTSEKFFIEFKRTVRFKIFDKAGFDLADFSIPLYKSGRTEERLTKFKANVYNIENGEIEKTQVGRKELVTEETNDYINLVKIALPQIKEGTVFEINYAVRSPFIWNLQDWQFQYQIPVKYSTFEVLYPEWFQYDKKFKGYDYQYLTVNDETSDNAHIAQWNVDYRRMRSRWVVEKMPAFNTEGFVSSLRNYLFTVDFELASTRFPNSIHKSYIGDWPKISQELMKRTNVGGLLAKGKLKAVYDQAKAVTATQSEAVGQIAAIYHYVQEKVVWNRRFSIGASKTSFSKILEARKGSSADINLLLVGMLKSVGFDAYPVALSTRSNGFLNPLFPSFRQFNYLIAMVNLGDGKQFLLDATDRTLPAGLLPPRCINDKGLVIQNNGEQWVSLTPKSKYRDTKQLTLSLNEEMEWTGEMMIKCKDYAARAVRHNFAKEEDEKTYIQSFENENEGLALSEASFENMTNINKETIEKYEVTFSNQVIDAGDMLYFNPLLTFAQTENPFKLEERKYPVDFNYPMQKIISAQFEIPEGYIVEEVPEKLVMALPEKGGKFMYSVTISGNKINVLNQFQVSKHLYLPEEYAALKQFYSLVVEKHGAQIVLKKKT